MAARSGLGKKSSITSNSPVSLRNCGNRPSRKATSNSVWFRNRRYCILDPTLLINAVIRRLRLLSFKPLTKIRQNFLNSIACSISLSTRGNSFWSVSSEPLPIMPMNTSHSFNTSERSFCCGSPDMFSGMYKRNASCNVSLEAFGQQMVCNSYCVGNDGQ